MIVHFFRWVIGCGAINDFAFSPCSKYLAVVSQDGCLRVFNYDAMELIGLATSFFGGLLCVCWSPDGQLVVAGGEDDLVTVWSFRQRRIVARGQGHRSWVTVIAFDPYTTTYSESITSSNPNLETTGMVVVNGGEEKDQEQQTVPQSPADTATCYRLGSVAMDTQLCLWELTDDVLKQPYGCRSRASMVSGPGSPPSSLKFNSQLQQQQKQQQQQQMPAAPRTPPASGVSLGTSLTQRLANSLTFAERRAGNHANSERSETVTHRKNFSLTGRSSMNANSSLSSGPAATSSKANNAIGVGFHSSASSSASSSSSTGGPDRLRLMGTTACPRLDEVPMLEPLVCKKVAQERLTALLFREDCLITACQDGIVCTWARPNTHHSTNEGTMV